MSILPIIQNYKLKMLQSRNPKINPNNTEILDPNLSDTPVILVHYMTLDFNSMEEKLF